MAKIKEIIENQKSDIKNIFQRYAVTLTAANLCCILYVILDLADYNWNETKLGAYIECILMGLSIGSFFLESVLTEDGSNRKKRVIPYIIMGIISFIFTYIDDILCPEFSDWGQKLFWQILVFCIILCIGLGIYGIIRKSGMCFQKYAVSFVFGIIKLGSIWLALNIGAILLLEMFDTLIVSIDYWDAVEYIEILLTGAVYLPYILICITDKKENHSKFVRGFVLYVLMPLVLAAFAIIYMYIIRIVITRHMPSNEVFNICAQLFAIGVIIWTMADSYRSPKEEKKDSKGGRIYEGLIQNIKYMYAPFILLECYAIGVRIGQYGVTQERYFAVVFIIAQIIYIVWEPIMALIARLGKNSSEKKTVGYEGMIFVGLLVYVICFLAPGINAEYMEYQSQKRIFESKLDVIENYQADIQANKYSFIENYEELRSVYRTLKWNVYGSEYIEDMDPKGKLEDLFSAYTYTELEEDGVWEYISVYYEDSVVNIAGYDKMYMVNDSYTPEISCNEELEISDEDQYLTISVSPERMYEHFIQAKKEGNYGVDMDPYEMEIDDNYKLIVSRLSFQYNYRDNTVRKISIRGYILER